MTTDITRPALRVVEPAAVGTSADRRLAVEHWLLSAYAAPSRNRTRLEWQEHGVAMLPCGTLFSAVRIPGRLVQALAGPTMAAADELLDQVLEGPVICDPHHLRYYALVPATMPTTWRQAVDDWRVLDVDSLGCGSYLGIPRLDVTDFDARACASYWSVPMSSAAMLCAPLNVARLIAAGRHQLVGEADA